MHFPPFFLFYHKLHTTSSARSLVLPAVPPSVDVILLLCVSNSCLCSASTLAWCAISICRSLSWTGSETYVNPSMSRYLVKSSDEFDSLLSSVILPIFTPLKSFLRFRCCPGTQTLSGAPKTTIRRFESLGEYSSKFYTGRLRSEVQLLSLPFIYHFHSHKM